MENQRLSEGITEILEILNHIDIKYKKVLPEKFMKFMEENKSKTYNPNIDFSKPIKDIEMKEETRNLLCIMYINYWSTQNEKEEFIKLLNENERKYQNKINEKYSQNNLFKRKNNIEQKNENNIISEENKLIKVEKSIFKKIWERILKIIKINKN